MDKNISQAQREKKTAIQQTPSRIEQINSFWRAANYLGAAQLYLKENPLLQYPLKPEHIKPRLLGHWGTQPGLNLIYAHLNRLIQDTGVSIMLVVGPGHGAPAMFACLYLEGTFGEFYPDLTFDINGLTHLLRQFSWPDGFPSHLSPAIPGAIQEGGELGYCLTHSFGAAFDNPDLIVACVVGDGEAETGALATSWHSNKFLNPATSGAALPILHLNGYKISSAAVYARMSDDELRSYFSGCGYIPRFVDGDDPFQAHNDMWQALDWAYKQIRAIQEQARSGNTPVTPAWPMIILRTPKGWTGPEELNGLPVEGSFRSHQVPITDPRENSDHLRQIESWLKSYRPEGLFDKDGRPLPDTIAICPKGDQRMGMNPHANGGQLLMPLNLPDYTRYAVEIKSPGALKVEGTGELGKYLRDIFKANTAERNFRFFCPDETLSNRMGAIFEATDRAFMWPIIDTDEHLAADGRVIEVLSEQNCEGWLEGYLLTGRHGVFACYEAFIPIIDSMMNQYAKWLKVSRETAWRQPIASLNYLLTSHVWRQDHNGYSHQVPSFIDNLLNKKADIARIYLPPDTNCLLSMMDHCLKSRDYVNLIVANKQAAPQWLDMKSAVAHCARGASVWHWASEDHGDPDIILAAAGDVPTEEVMAATELLRQEIPELRVRVVNVIDLFALASKGDHPHGLSDQTFKEIFMEEKPVVFAFHGYPRVIHDLVHHRPNPERFHVRGYIEEGRTTTPFDMLALNKISRYHLVMAAMQWQTRFKDKTDEIVEKYEKLLIKHREFIRTHGEDMPEITGWRWSGR